MKLARWMALASLCACGKVVGDLPFDGSPVGTPDARVGTPDARVGTVDAPVGGTPDARSDGGMTGTTIKAIRTSQPPDGAPVVLRGVVVIARETSGGNGTLVLMDADGGDFSGIILFCNFGDGFCNLTRTDIDTMDIGSIVDVSANFDLFQPIGVPAPPIQPRLIRAMVMHQGMMNLTSRTVPGGDIAPNQAGTARARALLWTYLRVDGPIVVTSVNPAQFMQMCPNPIDAGIPDVSHRAVVARVNGLSDLAVGVRRGDENANYCLFECEHTCMNQLMVNDTFGFMQGVLDTHNRASAAQGLLLMPVRNSDVGPKQ